MGIYGKFYYSETTYGPDLAIFELIPGYLSLRVVFLYPFVDDDELRNPRNYTITAVDAEPTTQIHHSDVWEVTPEDIEYPTYVDLACTDLTHGKDYRLTITPDKITGMFGWKLINNNVGDYAGVSLIPAIQSIRPISDTIMEVVWNKEMSAMSDIADASRYSFDKGLLVREVIIVAPGVVHLVTTRQTPSELYTLTVT